MSDTSGDQPQIEAAIWRFSAAFPAPEWKNALFGAHEVIMAHMLDVLEAIPERESRRIVLPPTLGAPQLYGIDVSVSIPEFAPGTSMEAAQAMLERGRQPVGRAAGGDDWITIQEKYAEGLIEYWNKERPYLAGLPDKRKSDHAKVHASERVRRFRKALSAAGFTITPTDGGK